MSLQPAVQEKKNDDKKDLNMVEKWLKTFRITNNNKSNMQNTL